MGLFGKKSEPQLLNVPLQSLVQSTDSDAKAEVVQFYAIESDSITGTPDEPMYRMRDLTPITNLEEWWHTHNHYVEFDPYTNGKRTTYVLNHFNPYTSPNKKREEALLGQPMFEIDEGTGQTTFHRQYFEFLGGRNMTLVKIQAPQAWHDQRERMMARLDPDISVVWKPEWK